MKRNEVEIGGTYVAKVGKRTTEVRIEGENAKGGWNAVSVETGKPVRIKSPQHLRPVKAGAAAEVTETTGGAEAEGNLDPDTEQSAPGDDADLVPLTALDKQNKAAGKSKGKGRSVKVAKATGPKERKPAKDKPTKEKKPKAMSCLHAAAAVLKAKGEPMRCIDMVAAMKEQKLWESAASTPAATLYSAILREIGNKGADARFEKTDRGHFALKD